VAGLLLGIALGGVVTAAHQANAQGFARPSGPEVRMTRAERERTVRELGTLFAEGYFDSTLGERVRTRLLDHQRRGRYREIERPADLTAALVRDVQELIHDGHFNMLHFPPAAQGFNWVNAGDGPRDEQAMLEDDRKRLRVYNYGVTAAEVLEGNIGYLNLARFDAPPELLREPLASAFRLLANTDALIVDVRRNPGGHIACVQLAFSYFVEGPPSRTVTEITRMKKERKEHFTVPDPGGPKYLGRPVYVLTGAPTASGGEMFAYQMKNHGKAVVIGEKTAAAAHSFDTFKIGSERLGHTMVMLPNAHLVDEVTKTDWEGVGVLPHVAVPADQALTAARRRAFEDLMAKAQAPEERAAYQNLIEKLDYAATHAPPSPESLAKYAGRYGTRRVWVDGGILRYQRESGPRVEMQPVAEDTFELVVAMSPRPRVRFEFEGDRVRALILKSGSQEDRYPREE